MDRGDCGPRKEKNRGKLPTRQRTGRGSIHRESLVMLITSRFSDAMENLSIFDLLLGRVKGCFPRTLRGGTRFERRRRGRGRGRGSPRIVTPAEKSFGKVTGSVKGEEARGQLVDRSIGRMESRWFRVETTISTGNVRRKRREKCLVASTLFSLEVPP